MKAASAVADVAQRPAEPGQRGDRGGVAAGRHQRDLGIALQRERLGGDGRGPAEARVGRRLHRAAGGRVAARTHPAGDRVAEVRGRSGRPARRASGRTTCRSRRARAGPGAPPSWPPAYQSMRTVPPAAAICRAVASAWSRPNNVSASPWTTSVGRGDPVRDRRGGGAAQELRGGGGEPAGGGGLGVGGADGGGEAAAGGGHVGCGGRAGGCWGRGVRRRIRRSLDRPAGAAARGETGGEEHPGPAALEDPVRGEGAAGGRVGGQRTRCGGGVREQRLAQVVPGDHRRQRVDPGVVAGQQQRERPAVRPAGDAHPGIARTVLHHVGIRGQPVDQCAGVRHLEVRGVERDLPAAGAEAARRPREHDEPAVDQRPGVGVDRGLRAAEAVRDQDRGRRGGRRQVQRGVEGDRVRQPGAGGDLDLLLDRAGRRGGVRGRSRREQGAGGGEDRRAEQGDRQPQAAGPGPPAGRGCHDRDGRAVHRQVRAGLSRFSGARDPVYSVTM